MKKIKYVVLFLSIFSVGCSSFNKHGDINVESDVAKIKAIFAAHDKKEAGLEEYLPSVADDIILMAHNQKVVEGKEAYKAHLANSAKAGDLKIKHELISSYSYSDVVIARGKASGSFKPAGQAKGFEFQTKNIFIFRRLASGELSVWQIMFNMDPK